MYNGLLKSFLIILAAFAAMFLLFAASWSADWEVSPRVEIIEDTRRFAGVVHINFVGCNQSAQ